ncbi:accelerated cell death 11-like [Quercus lobata]|uniref:accelerated cell death 11-like n=1 Tax=Quercus lobata TaxID=97700 RepID=UPI001247B2B0|nr:accelerated cell death 11-like [Quercus lobata]XP_030956465.1 accelerated cell death 11-like [Quercus lobata]
MGTRDNPVRKLADSLQVLADTVNSDNPHIKVSDLVQFCRISYTAIFYFGITVKFPDLDPQTKVDNFLEASKKYDTIQDLVESEIKNGTARDNGSPCRTLARLRRVIDLAREVLEQIFTSGRVAAQSIEGNSQPSSFDFTLLRKNSFVETFAVAYEQVFVPYPGWTAGECFSLSVGLSKNIVLAALEELPPPDLLLKILNEDEDSVKEPIHKYINAAKVVLQYIDSVFLSTETGAEMLRTI